MDRRLSSPIDLQIGIPQNHKFRGEASLIVTPEQGRRYVAIADAIVRSAQEHKTILVDI